MFRAARLFSQTERFFLTEPRRSPAAAGLPRPEAGSGAPEGLELSPCSVFRHESGRYPTTRDVQLAGGWKNPGMVARYAARVGAGAGAVGPVHAGPRRRQTGRLTKSRRARRSTGQGYFGAGRQRHGLDIWACLAEADRAPAASGGNAVSGLAVEGRQRAGRPPWQPTTETT